MKMIQKALTSLALLVLIPFEILFAVFGAFLPKGEK